MATLAEIRDRPADYLGEDDDEVDYQMFIDAVEALMVSGLSEEDAIKTVWHEGDWVPVADAIVRGEWRPTHRVRDELGTHYYMLAEGGLYTPAEWVFATDPTYEFVDGELYLNGRPAALAVGAWEVEEL